MSRRKITFAALLAVAAMPMLALASPVSDLHEFQTDEPVLASQFNDNFSDLETAVNDNDTRISALEDEPELIVVRASNTITIDILQTSTTILFNDEAEDSHDAYDVKTGVFTCPRPGLLQASYNVFFQDITSSSTRLLVVEGPGQEYELARRIDTTPVENLAGALAIRCGAAGDEWIFRAGCDQAGGCETRAQSGLRTFSNLSIVETR